MLTLKGIATSPGIAIGTVVIVDTLSYTPALTATARPEAEFERILEAARIAKTELYELYRRALTDAGQESALIFNSHVEMLNDTEYLDCIHEIIRHDSCTGEYAVYAAGIQFIHLFDHMDNEYMRERAADIRDITKRLLRLLSGQKDEPLKGITGPVILAAQELLPSQIFLLDKQQSLAFLSQKGSINSHASILAKNLGIPCVTALNRSYESIHAKELLIVDGWNGLVICKPEPDTLLTYQSRALCQHPPN